MSEEGFNRTRLLRNWQGLRHLVPGGDAAPAALAALNAEARELRLPEWDPVGRVFLTDGDGEMELVMAMNGGLSRLAVPPHLHAGCVALLMRTVVVKEVYFHTTVGAGVGVEAEERVLHSARVYLNTWRACAEGHALEWAVEYGRSQR